MGKVVIRTPRVYATVDQAMAAFEAATAVHAASWNHLVLVRDAAQDALSAIAAAKAEALDDLHATRNAHKGGDNA